MQETANVVRNDFRNIVGGPLLGDDVFELSKNWKWVLATGIVYIVLGVVAFSIPVASTLGVTYALGAILLVGGVASFINSIRLRMHRAGATRFFQAALAIITGGLMLRYPAAGMAGLTIALSFYFFVGAASQSVVASAMGPNSGRGWIIASSIASFLLGVFIIMSFPVSALWVPGTFLGIDLLLSGSAMTGLAFTLRKLKKEFEARGEGEPPAIERAA